MSLPLPASSGLPADIQLVAPQSVAPAISVVVPVRDGGLMLARSLDALAASTGVAWVAALGPVAVLLTLNRALYGFFLRERGPRFLLRVLPLHWLYFAYSALSFAYRLAAHRLGTSRRRG